MTYRLRSLRNIYRLHELVNTRPSDKLSDVAGCRCLAGRVVINDRIKRTFSFSVWMMSSWVPSIWSLRSCVIVALQVSIDSWAIIISAGYIFAMWSRESGEDYMYILYHSPPHRKQGCLCNRYPYFFATILLKIDQKDNRFDYLHVSFRSNNEVHVHVRG